MSPVSAAPLTLPLLSMVAYLCVKAMLTLLSSGLDAFGQAKMTPARASVGTTGPSASDETGENLYKVWT